MNIFFEPLNELHFNLLLKWLESSHIKKWWDSDVSWTLDLIIEKYRPYTKGHKVLKNLDVIIKPIHAFIIYYNNEPIGYIQYYNKHDFYNIYNGIQLPELCAGIDWYIGEADYIGSGIGLAALKQYLEEMVYKKYRYAFMNPEYSNAAAVSACEKAGFVILKRVCEYFWMIACKKIVRLSVLDTVSLDIAFRESFLKNDSLWVFGSRADLTRKGGDIDLYIETNASSIDEAVLMKSNFLRKLESMIGEQKIDIVLNTLHFPYHLPIHDIAKIQGVKFI